VPVVRDLPQVVRQRLGEGGRVGQRGVGARLLPGGERRSGLLCDLGKGIVFGKLKGDLLDHGVPLLRADRRGSPLGRRRGSEGSDERESQGGDLPAAKGDETESGHVRLLS
jgi:hypothetical protein